MNNKIQIYVAGQDTNYFLKDASIEPRKIIYMNTNKPNVLTDSSDDNIAYKNPYYCELTALYWIWKNSNANIVGLEHYRRYFINSYFKTVLSNNEIIDILYNYDIILTPIYYLPRNTDYSPYTWWIKFGHVKELDKVIYIIKKIYPEYYQTCLDYMDNNKLYCCNMFITKKEICNDWCKFIFDILSIYEKIEGFTNKNYRIYGYIGEFLLGVWTLKNKLKIYECPKIVFNKNLTKII